MDIGIVWDAARFRGDWDVTSGDLAIDVGGLRSAVLVSLFTHKEAPPDYQPPAGQAWDRRGVWTDTYEPDDLPAGSWLWLLNRRIKTPTLLNEAAGYASDALQWLKQASIVSAINVGAAWMQPTVIGLSVNLTRPSAPPFAETFGWAWQGAT